MTITLPDELERSIQAAVHSGRFASVDDAMAEAARLLLREMEGGQRPGQPSNANDPAPDMLLGFMRDDPELMDEIVADAYRQRRAISPISRPRISGR
jgi:Arc/MetJ-type ribon-helix-helix transcriptional regulator